MTGRGAVKSRELSGSVQRDADIWRVYGGHISSAMRGESVKNADTSVRDSVTHNTGAAQSFPLTHFFCRTFKSIFYTFYAPKKKKKGEKGFVGRHLHVYPFQIVMVFVSDHPLWH